MCRGRRVSAAIFVAAAFVLCCVGVSNGPAWAGDDGAQFLLFSGADLWLEPAPATMIAADISLSSIINSYSARAAFGWRLHDWFYLGPEAQTFACTGFTQARFGLHLTGLKTQQFEWSVAAGWARDSDHRSSPYLRIGVLMRR